MDAKSFIANQQQPSALDNQLAHSARGLDHKGLAPARTIAVVGTELQAAMDAAARVPKLREELDGLLGRKRRGAKKGTP